MKLSSDLCKELYNGMVVYQLLLHATGSRFPKALVADIFSNRLNRLRIVVPPSG